MLQGIKDTLPQGKESIRENVCVTGVEQALGLQCLPH